MDAVYGLFFALALTLAGPSAALSKPEKEPRSPEKYQPERRYISAHAYYHAVRAELARKAGDLELARQSLRLALVYDPGSAALHVALSRVLLELGRPVPLEMVSRAVELAPRSALGWRLRGDVLVRQGKASAAERAYAKAFNLQPDDAEGVLAALELARLLTARGELDRVEPLLRRASQHLDLTEASLALGDHLLSLGRVREAEAIYAKAAVGASADELASLARRYEWLAEDELAFGLWLRRFEDAVWLSSAPIEDLIDAARVAWRLGREPALQRTMAALRAARAEAAERVSVLRALLSLGDPDAQAALASIAAADPAYDQAQLILAMSEIDRGELGAAASRLESCHTRNPSSVAITSARVDLLERRGAHAEALSMLEEQLRTHGPDRSLIERRALISIRLGRPAEAQRALEAHPDRKLIPAIFASLAIEAGQTPTPDPQLRRVLGRRPLDPRSAFVLASVAASDARRWGRALPSLERALREHPDDARLWWAVGRGFARRGSRERARVALARASAIRPWDVDIWRARAELETDPSGSEGRARAILERIESRRHER